MNYAVVFTVNNAVIVKDIKSTWRYRLMPNALVNPSLSAVAKVPTEAWQIRNGSLAPATHLDRAYRALLGRVFGSDIRPRCIIWYPLVNLSFWQDRLWSLAAVAVGIAVGKHV